LQESPNGNAAWEKLMSMIRDRKLSVFVSAPDLDELDLELRDTIKELVGIASLDDSDAKKMKEKLLSTLLYQHALLASS
jgi:hypothetical protein